MARINFIELPARDLGAARTFYSAVFGWKLTDFGSSYSCTMTGNLDRGLQEEMSEATRTSPSTPETLRPYRSLLLPACASLEPAFFNGIAQ